jgi:hypothetical protein
MDNITFGSKGIKTKEEKENLLATATVSTDVDYTNLRKDVTALLAESQRLYDLKPTKEMYDLYITLKMASQINFERN